jgi:hypothetical protein
MINQQPLALDEDDASDREQETVGPTERKKLISPKNARGGNITTYT